MLDVGFSEILLTSAIALIVLGPERLPKVARQVGNWMGRARAMARQLSEQLEREVSAEELLKAQNKPNPNARLVDSVAPDSTAMVETSPVVAPARVSTAPPKVPHPTSAAAMHAADIPPQAELPLSDPNHSPHD
jgi:sec-independent protein translocase protein TatB